MERGDWEKSGAVSQWPVAGNGSSCPAGQRRTGQSERNSICGTVLKAVKMLKRFSIYPVLCYGQRL